MIMKLFLIMIITLDSIVMAGKLRGCIETDICESIQFNNLVLGSIANDIGELSFNATIQFLNSAEEMRQATRQMKANLALSVFDTKELDGCHRKGTELDQLINKLEMEIERPWPKDDSLQVEMSDLQQEKDALGREMAELMDELRLLEEKFDGQQTTINGLLKKVNKPIDCADIQALGNNRTGIYKVHPFGDDREVPVLCDLNVHDGGWTVFLKRQPQAAPLDFDKTWEDYKAGFGDLSTEFWLGNDLLHVMTSFHGPVTMRIGAESFTGRFGFAEWSNFSVDDEAHKYQLRVGGYDPTSILGDSITESNGMFFTTGDRDNDNRKEFNCATGGQGAPMFGKGGWWYTDCGSARPTAPLLNTNYLNSAYYSHWNSTRSDPVSLKTLTMMFRRSNYKDFAQAGHNDC